MSSFLQPIGPWLVPLGWLALEAAVVVLAALALQPLLRTAAATRRSLWRAVLVALGLLLAAEFTGATGQFSAQLRAVWQTVFAKPAPPQLPPPPSVAFPLPDSPMPMPAFLPEPEPLPDFTALPPAPLPPAHSLTLSPAPAPALPVWPAFLWLTGLAALLARSAWTHVGFAWLRLRHFLPAAEALCERVQVLALRLGLRRRVRVLASERLRAPAAFGWLRPGVGVPGDFTARFGPAQQDVMLAHELAHLAARDPLWQLLADLVTAALWWHPLAWVARRQHRLAGELAADDASLALPDGPVVLAECLLTLGHEAADCPRAALGMAGFRSQLGRRVERLLALPRRDWQAPSRARLALQTAVALLALAALALLPGCAANRTAGEAPSGIVAKWWQAKDRKPEPPRTTAKERTVETQDFGTTIFRLFNERRQLSEGASSSVRLAELENQIAATITAEVARLRAEFTAASAKLPTDLELLRKHLEKVNQSLKQLVRAVNTNTLKSDQRHLDVMQRHREEVENKIKVEELDRAIPRFATQGRVLFNGTPLPERDIPLPPPVLAARTNTPLKTRFHRVSPDGGLADVLVYVKEGLAGQTFDPPTNVFVVWADRYEFEPYIGAIQAGQTVRWESRLATGLSIHPTPTNRENREFNFTLMANKSLDARFTGPELFLRVKTDVYPWMFHYISVLPHPYFAVTDAEGRFRFPSPLPPGKYTLAAVHRRAGEAEQMLDLTQPLPAGASVPSVEFHFNAPAGGVTTLPPLISFPQRPAPPVDFAPSKPPTREELLERKARVEAEIKAVEKVYRPTHPKMIGLRKQLESVEEALRQQALVPRDLEYVSVRLKQLEHVERKLQNPVYTTSERLQFYAAVDYGTLRETPTVGNPRTTNGTVIVPRAPGAAIEDWAELERQRLNLERTIKEASQTYRPSHPKMQTLNKQLEAINRLLEEEEQKAAAKFKFLKRTLQQQQRELLDQQGATLPPAPVAADVRRLTSSQTPDAIPLTPPASQSLVTSAATNAAPRHHQPTVEKLARIRLPEVTYDGLPLPEVLKMLEQDTKKHDPDEQGISFGMRAVHEVTVIEATTPGREISVPAKPLDLTQAQSAGSGTVGVSLTATVPLPRSRVRQVAIGNMDTVLIKVTTVLRDVSVLDALDAIVKTAGSAIGYTVETNRVVIHPRLPGWEFVSPRVGAAVRGASVRAKAEEIVLPEVSYPGLPLTEVVKFLVADTRKLDADKRGLNFLVTSHYPDLPVGELRVVPMLDGNGNPIPGTEKPLPGPDLNVAVIRLSERRTNQSVAQTLDALCAASSLPIAWRAEDFGILLTPKFPAPGAPADHATQTYGLHLDRLLTALARELCRDKGALSTNDAVLNGLLTDYLRPHGFGPPAGQPPHFRVFNGLIHYTGPRAQAEDFARRIIGLVRSVPAPPKPAKSTPAPKPGAAAPAPPAPVAADVRRLQSNGEGGTRNAESSQSLLTSAATNAVAAPDPLQAAQEEALRRQERKMVLDKLLGEAGQFQKIKSWTNAVVRYEEGLLLAPPLNGPFGAPRQVTDAIAGLNYCRLQLAIEHKQRSEFAQATELADKVLALDPANDFARLIKQLVERVSKPTPSGAAVSVDAADQAKAERLIASTRLRLDQNNTRDAFQNLWAALLTNPRSDADSSLLLLLLDKRFEDERVRLAATQWGRVVAVTQKWNEAERSKNGLPVPNPYAKTNSQVPFLTHSSKGAQRINRKREEIVLPEVHFDGVTLAEVLKRLDADAKQFDPEPDPKKKGLNFLINDVAPAAPLLDAAGNPVPVARPVALSEGLVRVSQPLKNLTLRQALDVICKNAELPTQFSVEEYAIAFIPRGPVAYYSRMFRVNPDAFIQGLQGVVGNPVLGVTPGGNNVAGATGQNQPATTTTTTGPVRATVPATVPATQRTAAGANALVRQFFQSAGVTSLGATNGSTRVTFNPENGLLLVRGTTNDLRVIEQAIQKVQPTAVSK